MSEAGAQKPPTTYESPTWWAKSEFKEMESSSLELYSRLFAAGLLQQGG